MLIVSILLSIAAIGALCGLLFTLSTLALPLLIAVPAFLWAEHAGAGLAGGVAVGTVVAFLVLFAGQVSVQLIRPTWARLAIALAFVAPAGIAGYHATHGIVTHLMPSGAWQLGFSILGAIAVAATTFLRLTQTAPSALTTGGTGRA